MQDEILDLERKKEEMLKERAGKQNDIKIFTDH
jgi:hypothetical protein